VVSNFQNPKGPVQKETPLILMSPLRYLEFLPTVLKRGQKLYNIMVGIKFQDYALQFKRLIQFQVTIRCLMKVLSFKSISLSLRLFALLCWMMTSLGMSSLDSTPYPLNACSQVSSSLKFSPKRFMYVFLIGYRHIQLMSNTGEKIPNCSLFVHVAITNKRGGGVSLIHLGVRASTRAVLVESFAERYVCAKEQERARVH
jgi:hypothetical protein